MDNPFQIITDAFAPDYQINLSIQGLDGSIMLTLSNSGRIVAKRMISAEQRNDPKRLKLLVQSIQFGIAIEQGHSAMAILEARPRRRADPATATIKGQPRPAAGL